MIGRLLSETLFVHVFDKFHQMLNDGWRCNCVLSRHTGIYWRYVNCCQALIVKKLK